LAAATPAHHRGPLILLDDGKLRVADGAYNQLQNFTNPLPSLHASSVSTVSTRKRRATMLRAGLTGGLGSGKSTVAAILRTLGANVLEADAVGRQLMEPGHAVFDAIVETFGPEVLKADGTLDRRRLADLAFGQNRLAELNHIVHPPVVKAQQSWAEDLFAQDPSAVAIVESALIFEADRQGTIPGWRQRFDRIILVTAPVELRIARYVERMRQHPNAPSPAELEADASVRLAAQLPDEEKIPLADYVIHNGGSLDDTRRQTETIYAELASAARV
jgi:dephospho-CoA kinase